MTEEITFMNENGVLTISCSGRITSSNAREIEEKLRVALGRLPHREVELDFAHLDYISSAGLRIILRLKQEERSSHIVNVQPAVYDILEMTGFTDIIQTRRAYRVLSVEGCGIVGEGANGKVYRIDEETLVKVYRSPDSLKDIHRERDLARAAFIAGVPTAIPYDVVQIEGGGYGSVFELLNAESLAGLIARGEMSVEEAADLASDLLRQIHSRETVSPLLPDYRQIALRWTDDLVDILPPERLSHLRSLILAVPSDNHMLHGDFHLKNIMLQNGECLLIDMDTLSHGHPIFDLAGMYNAHSGYGISDASNVANFLGIPYDTARDFWHRCLPKYLSTEDSAALQAVEDRARILGYTRIIRRTLRRNGMNIPSENKLIHRCMDELSTLLDRVDSLTF